MNWFGARGHEISLIADAPLIDPWPGIRIVELPARFNRPFVRYLPWTIWTRAFIQRWQPEILHAHRVSSAGWLGAFSGFHPFVVTPWGSDLLLHPKRSIPARLLAQIVLHTADIVTVNSHELSRAAMRMGASPQAIHPIQWGVDLSRFHPGAVPQSLLDELRIGSAQVIFSPRGMNPIYNIEYILQAFEIVRRSLQDTLLLLIDYNPEPDYRYRIRHLIHELNLVESVRWLNRIEPWERMVDYYRLATVVVSVPSSDSTSASLLEALACGTPIVASNLPATREWIVDGVNGTLVPARDRDRLAEALIDLLNDAHKRALFASRSLVQVQEKADHNLEMNKMLRLYEILATR